MSYNTLKLLELEDENPVTYDIPIQQLKSNRVRSPSIEILKPEHHDIINRKSSVITSVFNLVATVCGGGVLSLPYAFSIGGIVHTTILMIITSIITNFSLYILCSCSRRTGGTTYGDVARFAFGPIAEIITTLLLFFLLICIIVGYMVLLMDIWTPIVVFLLKTFCNVYSNNTNHMAIDEDDKKMRLIVLVSLLVFSFPLMLQKDLYALRNVCYVGFISALILCVSLAYCAWDQVQHSEHLQEDDGSDRYYGIRLYADNSDDLLFVFPIIVLSFFSSFNVLSVHSALINPTRKRLKSVLDASILLCFVLFFVVALSGYIYTYSSDIKTRDNIFLNFSSNNRIMMIGRTGYAFTILFGLPLVILPCRTTVLSLPSQIKSLTTQGFDQLWKSPILPVSRKKALERMDSFDPAFDRRDIFDEMSPLLPAFMNDTIKKPINKPIDNKTSESRDKILQSSDIASESRKKILQSVVSTSMKKKSATTGSSNNTSVSEFWVRIWITIFLVCICFIFAVAVPGVGTVWRICGSSLAITIAYIIPSACYLKIRYKKGINPRSIGSVMLLVFSISTSYLCTRQIISDSF